MGHVLAYTNGSQLRRKTKTFGQQSGLLDILTETYGAGYTAAGIFTTKQPHHAADVAVSNL